jgi:hypothetical protein
MEESSNAPKIASLEELVKPSYFRILVVSSPLAPIPNLAKQISKLGYSVQNTTNIDGLMQEIESFRPHLVFLNRHNTEDYLVSNIRTLTQESIAKETESKVNRIRMFNDYSGTEFNKPIFKYLLDLDHASVLLVNGLLDYVDFVMPENTGPRVGIMDSIGGISNIIAAIIANKGEYDPEETHELLRDSIKSLYYYISDCQDRAPDEKIEYLREVNRRVDGLFRIIFESSLANTEWLYKKFNTQMESEPIAKPGENDFDNISLFDIKYIARRQSKHATVFVMTGDSYAAIEMFFHLDYKHKKFWTDFKTISKIPSQDVFESLTEQLIKDKYHSLIAVQYNGKKEMSPVDIAFEAIMKYTLDNYDYLRPAFESRNKLKFRIPGSRSKG